MNSLIKKSVLSLILTGVFLTGIAAGNDSKDAGTISESIIERLTEEVKSKVNLTEATKIVRESALVVVQLVLNSDGRVVVNNSSANNAQFEDYVTDKLNDINIEFSEEHFGKAVIYRFKLI